MRIIGRLVALFFGLIVAAALAGTVAARAAKERIVRREEPDADEVAVAAIFEPLAFRSTAQRFRGGTLDTWYGGGMFDLRDATLDPAGATLEVRAIFGGGQILVPEGWQVETQVIGLGGAGDSRPSIDRAPDAPRLLIRGLAIFGGFGVSSTMPPDGESWLDRTRAERSTGTTEPAEPVAVMSE